MSEITGTTNQTGLRLKQIHRKLKFMEEISEQVPKSNRKEFLVEMALTRQEEKDVVAILEKTGGVMK